MANSSKLFLLTLLSPLLIACMINARPLVTRSSLVNRLKLDDESSNCWDSLIQIQSCSGEIIMFFLNGETYLGNGCCNAIRIIGKQCWPNMIDTLGFTAAEGDMLEEYCDHDNPAAIVHNHNSQSIVPVEPHSGVANLVEGLVP